MKPLAKTILRIWLISWVVTLPLVHVHPEADHAHGMPGHVHGGTYHTLFACGSFCESHDSHHHPPHQSTPQHVQQHEASFLAGEDIEHSHSSSPLPHDFDHTTYGFSALNSWTDGQVEKGEFSSVSLPTLVKESQGQFPGVTQDIFQQKTFFSTLPKTRSPRAPPSVIL